MPCLNRFGGGISLKVSVEVTQEKVGYTNNHLNNARRNEKDEFYTKLEVIEKELIYHERYFKGKVIYCNCDNPFESNFVRYFMQNFSRLGLKRFIATSYVEQEINLFNPIPDTFGLVFDYKGDNKYLESLFHETDNQEKVEAVLKGEVQELQGDGDFRSHECKRYLEEADIVVTNPPFSLFREYINQLLRYKKDFIILGNLTACGYRDIFPLFKHGRIRFGHSISSGDVEFRVPNDYPLHGSYIRTDKEGNNYIRVAGIRWYTTLPPQEEREFIPLTKNYDPAKYPKYDNYDAINVNRTSDIPKDYDGVIGVPITYLDKHNPKQFEIVDFRKGVDGRDLRINGEIPFSRILIRKR